MDDLNAFVMEEGRGFYRPVGRVTFDELTAMVGAALATARRRRARDVLIDTTRLVGFPSPDTFQRFLAVIDWVSEAKSDLRMVLLARPEMIDPHRFGVVVASNRGMTTNIFSDEAKALAWLEDSRDPAP